MTWKEHINSVISKINSCLGVSRRARPFLTKNALLTIYHSLMQSKINYCIETWGAWQPRGNKTILQRLQAVSNKFFRLIHNMERYESVRNVLKDHQVLNVFQNYDFHVLQIMQKAVNNEVPIPIKNQLTTLNEYFFFKKPHLKQSERSVSFAGPKLWNGLPIQLITESNFNSFKRDLKTHILNKT